MRTLLYPRITRTDALTLLKYALAGAVVAGLYGVAHDQVTFSISPEYFTKLKFHQFHYADFGLGERAHVAAVGFLATWWVGLFVGWFQGRRVIPRQSRADAFRTMRAGFAIVFIAAVLGATAGWLYGVVLGPDHHYTGWTYTLRHYDIADRWAFIRVAYIHNASYAGGLLGFIAALIFLRPRRAAQQETVQPTSGAS